LMGGRAASSGHTARGGAGGGSGREAGPGCGGARSSSVAVGERCDVEGGGWYRRCHMDKGGGGGV
jgi:hypothetical protein